MVETLKDRRGGNPRELHMYGKKELKKTRNASDLIDVWRTKHPNKKQFSWHSRYANISSRLDRIYIPSHWISNVTSQYIDPFVWSDHDMCTMNIYLQKDVQRGKGIWKMNLTLLDDQKFQTHIRKFWREWSRVRSDYADAALWWDIGKTFIKRIAIDISTSKQQKHRNERTLLVRELQEEREKNPRNQENIVRITEEIKQIDIGKTNKIFISAHKETIELGEKPTKYFFNQLKGKQARHAMSTL